TQLSNTITIADDGTNGADANPADNSGSDTTPIVADPSVGVTKSDGGATTTPGGTVAYTITATNTGNQDASAVTLNETVPANTTFNAGASTAGWVCAPNNNAGSTCTLNIGAVAGGGGTGSATFAVDVVNPVPAGTIQIANSVTTSYPCSTGTCTGGPGTDTTPVTSDPNVGVAKS